MICLYQKIQENFVLLILQVRFRVVQIPLVCMVKLKFLGRFPVDHFPHLVVSLFVIISCVRLIVSSPSPHSLYLLFCRVSSIFASTLFVLMALSSAAIRRDSVSLLRFSLLNYVQIFSWEILLVCQLKYLYDCFSSYLYGVSSWCNG